MESCRHAQNYLPGLTPDSKLILETLSINRLAEKFPNFKQPESSLPQHNKLPSVLTPNERDPIYDSNSFNLLNMQINIIPSTPSSPKCISSSCFLHQNLICTPFLPHICHMSLPTHFSALSTKKMSDKR